MDALAQVDDWPVENAAAAVIHRGALVAVIGDANRPFELASLTKLMTSMAALVAHEEGTLDLDEPITDAAATVADLLAHSGGVAPEPGPDLSPPNRRRVYSSYAYELVGARITERSGMDFPEYLDLAVQGPLAMSRRLLAGSAGSGAAGSVNDMVRLVSAWRDPLLVHSSTLHRARVAHQPDLAGVLPGFGRQEPNPWGLGPEIRGTKSPHWTGTNNSPETFGHFGRSGTMLWLDPSADVALIALADRPFGDWAATAWPLLSDAVLSEATAG